MLCKYPLKWPANTPRTSTRRTALFTHSKQPLTPPRALDRLELELRRLGVTDSDSQVILLSNLKPSLRGATIPDQANPKDPGVVVHWEVNGKERTMAIDIYDRPADNIAAIAAVLEYLRGIERQGGAAVQEQAFSGFDALPPPDSCWKILAIDEKAARAKTPAMARQYVMDAFRIAARGGHEDAGADVSTDMARLVRARDEAFEQLGVA